jgi:dTDP-4-dehydrorhamnose 3,5-epimerase
VEVLDARLQGAKLIRPGVHGDDRGFFLESYRIDRFAEAGVTVEFVQDNHSRSRRGVVRGMHFQPGQAKLVRCARGAIFDVIADIRVGSPTFGQWDGYQLDDESHHQLFIPVGFAHGFCVISDVADVVYQVSDYYDPAAESGFRFDDPAVGIRWPIPMEQIVSSERDRAAAPLAEIASPFSYDA